jgi:hypothetical protein
MEPATFPVTEVSEPPALDEQLVRQISAIALNDAKVLLRQVPGVKGYTRVNHKRLGPFACAWLRGSRVLIYPVIVDHVKSHEEYGEYQTYEDALDRAIEGANKLADALEAKDSAGIYSLFRSHVIFAFYDPLGYVDDWLKYRSYPSLGGNIDLLERNGLISTNVGTMRCALFGRSDAINLEPCPTSVSKALELDARFCKPSSHQGRWKQIETAFARLELFSLFSDLHRILREAGWMVVQDTYLLSHYYEVRYTTPEPKNARDLSVLFGLSSASKGIAIVPWSDGSEALKDHIHWLRGSHDVKAFAERFSRT